MASSTVSVPRVLAFVCFFFIQGMNDVTCGAPLRAASVKSVKSAALVRKVATVKRAAATVASPKKTVAKSKVPVKSAKAVPAKKVIPKTVPLRPLVATSPATAPFQVPSAIIPTPAYLAPVAAPPQVALNGVKDGANAGVKATPGGNGAAGTGSSAGGGY